MNYLVTGSRGFIGQHLVKRLLSESKGGRVIGVSRTGPHESIMLNDYSYGAYQELNGDLSFEEEVAWLLDKYKPDVIFHLAGNPIVKPQQFSPAQIIYDNVISTQLLLHYAPLGCKFILASSATVYGDSASYKTCNELSLLMPSSPYGATKVAAEAMVEAYTSIKDISGVSLRYVANVGPKATHGLVKDIVTKLKSSSEHLELLGKHPGSLKPYIHIEDTITATLMAAKFPGPKYNVFNVSTKNVLYVEDVANVVMRAMGVNKPIRWLGEASNWAGDNPIVKVDSSKIEMGLDWKPMYKTSETAIYSAVKEMIG